MTHPLARLCKPVIPVSPATLTWQWMTGLNASPLQLPKPATRLCLPKPEDVAPLFPPLQPRPHMTLRIFIVSVLLLIINWRWWCGLPKKVTQQEVPISPLVIVLIPAHNEQDGIAKTIRSALKQPHVRAVVVVNDGSTDYTQHRAELFAQRYPGRVIVLNLPKASGHKAGALNAAIGKLDDLGLKRTEFTAVVDSDSVVTMGSIELMLRHFYDRHVAQVGARVVAGPPRNGNDSYARRAKDGENRISQLVAKQAQGHVGTITVSAGCCSIIRTSALMDVGGFNLGQRAEDMDWTLRASLRYRVAYESDAVCLSEEPKDWRTFVIQRMRWSQGSIQCFLSHAIHGDMWKKNLKLWGMLQHVFISGFLAPIVLFMLTLSAKNTALPWAFNLMGIQPNEVLNWSLAVISPFVLYISMITILLIISTFTYPGKYGTREELRTAFKCIIPTFIATFIVMAVFWHSLWKVFFSKNQDTAWGKGH